MDLFNSEHADIIMVCVALSGLLLTVGVVMLLRSSLRAALRWLTAAFNPGARVARAGAAELATTLNELRTLAEELQPYEVDYHNAFDDAGWAALLQELQALDEAEKCIAAMIENGSYDDAIRLAGILLDQLPEDLSTEAAERFPEFAALRGWTSRSHAVLLSLVDTLRTAASESQELGVTRRRNRRPTLETLGELRDWLRSR